MKLDVPVDPNERDPDYRAWDAVLHATFYGIAIIATAIALFTLWLMYHGKG